MTWSVRALGSPRARLLVWQCGRRLALALAVVAGTLLLAPSEAYATISVSVTATGAARRQEAHLPTVEPSTITVRVTSDDVLSSLQVHAIALAFTAGGTNVDSQFTVTGPSPSVPSTLPLVTLFPESRVFEYRVTPKPGATLYSSIDLKATVLATMTGLVVISVPLLLEETTSFTVTPGAERVLGANGYFESKKLREGLNGATDAWTDGTKLVVADRTNNRVLIWTSFPATNGTTPDIVLGQASFGSIQALDPPSAASLNRPGGVSSDGTRLAVADTGNNRVMLWTSFPARSGQPADLVLGQPSAVAGTGNNGGISGASTTSPAAVYVDSNRLAVADEGNNRVLIWTTLPASTGQSADLILGQPNATTNTANSGGLDLARMDRPRGVSINGSRLAVTDSGNNRVLVWTTFPSTTAQAADLVLGQPSALTNTANNGGVGPAAMKSPGRVSLDGSRLAVADTDNHRVLIWTTFPASTGQAADLVVGQPSALSSTSNVGSASATTLTSPAGVMSDGTRLLVADTNQSRILIWTAFPTQTGQAADRVLGQKDFKSGVANDAGTGLDAMASPAGISAAGNRVVVADFAYNRVQVWERHPTRDGQPADLTLGQPTDRGTQGNDGGLRSNRMLAPIGVSTDGTRLAVADQLNNRVLVWRSFPTATGQPPDLILGQPDGLTGTANSGGLSAATVNGPRGVAVEADRLAVADSGNNRVLVWTSFPTQTGQPADLVLGQPDALTNTANAGGITAGRMSNPADVAIDGTRLAVADSGNNRVLIWTAFPTAGGQAADLVLGQPNDLAGASNNGGIRSGMYSPTGVSMDGPRLAVADMSNSRVLIWKTFPTATGQLPSGVIGARALDETGTSALPDPFNTVGSLKMGVDWDGDLLWVSSPAAGERVLAFDTEVDFLRATLDFSRSTRLYKEEPVSMTASFSRPLAGTPLISIAGGQPGSPANDVDPVAMSATTDSRTFTFSRNIVPGDDGTFTVTLTAQDASSNPLPSQAALNTFTVDTTPPGVTLTYGDGSPPFGAGALAIAVTFSEPIVSSPTIAIDAPGTANDVTATALSPTADAKIWNYAAVVAPGSDNDGVATVTIAGGADSAGNDNDPASNSTFAIDTTAPTVALAYSKNTAQVGPGTLVITATFSEPLASTPTIGLAAPGATNDVSSAELERTADPLVWFYDAAIVAGTGNDGLATVAVGNALDAAGNVNGPPSNATFTIDVTGPTVGLSFSRAAGPIGVGPLTITATFGEPLDTTPTLAIQAPGSANDLDTTLLTATADPKVWTLAIAILSGTDTDGAATVTVAGVDIAGNPSQPAGSSGFEIDATAPAADLTYSRDPATVTAGQLRITATFDEPLTTAPTLAIAAPGTENDVSATEMTPTGDPKVWVFVATIVKGTGNDGDAFVTIAGGTDAAGNQNRPATHGSITLKTSIPGVELAYSRNPAAVGLGTLAITATFTEPILTVPNLSIAAPGSVNDATGVAMTATADARRWVHVATIAPGEGADGPALVSISNGRGEGGLENSPALNAAFTIDATAPTVALTTSKPAEAVGPGALTITAAFSEPLAATPTLAISAPGSANDAASAMNPTGDAKVWTYLAMIVAGSANDGQATVALTATDAAGNLAADAPNSSFTIDTTGPAVTLSYSKNPLAVGPGSLAITASFDEGLASTPTLAIAAPGSANDVTATAMSPTADGRVWTHVATIAPGNQGDGLALVTIAGATDFAGNQNQPASQATFTIGATPPSVTMTYSQNSAAVRPGPLGLTATFSAPLATTPTIAIEAPGSASDLTATAMTSTADARVWTLTATLASGGGADGLAVVTIANGRTQAGVENLAAENATFTIDGTPPAVALTYSKPVTAVGPGALAITATFNEALTTTPTVAVAAQGTANNFSATALTGTDDPKVWTFSAVIAAAAGSDGLAIVAIAGGSDLAGNENQPASNAELTLDVTRPQVSLTYSQSVSAVTSGELAITASFSEPIASTPTLLVDAPGSSNDVPGAAMTSTGNPRVWSHSTLIRQRSGLEGLATASIVNGKDAAGNENLPAVGGRFFVAPETSPLTPNQPPVARIRPQTLAGGPRLLSMDGLSSTDPEGGALTFAWTLEERPAGAAGFASDRATIEYPARLPGSYRFNLSVFDSGLLAASQSTTFTVGNVAPVAIVRELADIVLGRDARTTVRLDASGSFDDNGSPLTYRWTIEEAPDRAAGQSAPTTLAALSNDTSAQTELSFANTARSGTGSSLLAAGAYVVRLTVSDGVETSSVTQRIRAIDPLFLLPVADAGPDRSIRVTFRTDGSPEPTIPGLLPSAGSSPVSTDRVTLDGRESCDPAKRSITYTWSVRTAPAGSAVTALSNGNSAFPSFKPDRAGRYRFRLTVSNGLAASAPDEVDVLIRSGNEPPVASPRSEDLARVRRSSLANPVLAFNVGDRIVLDATDSSDPDPADRGQLRYQWTQTEGSRTSLEPVSTAPVVSFAPVGIGRASFELTVTDPQGETDSRPVGVVVLPAGTQVTDGGVPLVSVVASASTTTATGGDFPPEGISLARPRSLRVAIASSPPSLVVTLSASVTRTATTVDRLDFVWRQVAGPTVVLTNPGESRTASRTSVTSFAPTTSRIHEFELSVFPLDPVGSRTELVARRRIRVVVDSPDSTVPEAAGSVTPAALTSGVTTAERTITLDATSSRLVGVLAQSGRKLAYNWRQLAGPEGQFENPFSARTQFVAPLPRSTGPETFLFELTVDVTPPGDRSEPIYFAVEQASSSGSSVPGSSSGSLSGGGGGGGGCGLARASGGAGPGWLDLLWYLLPLAYLRRPSPMRR